MQSQDEHSQNGNRTGAHAARVSSISPAEAEAQKLDGQAMELAGAFDDQSGPQDAHLNQDSEHIAATPYLGTFELPDSTSSQEPQDPADQPSSRIFFPTHPRAIDFRPGKNAYDDEVGSRDFRGAGPAHRAYTRQLLQAQHFRSISDTTSIVAVLIAALPWAILSQPVVPPTIFTSATTFTFAALSSSLSVILALLCQFAKLLYTLRPPGRTGFRTTMLAYVLEDVAQLALLQIGLVAILFFLLWLHTASSWATFSSQLLRLRSWPLPLGGSLSLWPRCKRHTSISGQRLMRWAYHVDNAGGWPSGDGCY
ncbi:hypothetical protein EJ03DRAFT_330615 [Teratosphaeria nubilosa]|uniref:Uncharacterized protein n=1 Tax=Teratosphaeria nubilosa TaxID=161662 RepID=A0A6G1KZJ5_9PEZI|nr:hypothetical protein EJ03DRAFT_330615 [Teratosphaeria nubilosa]